jgi:regulatory protein YycI of two-component signal transduction system YycFG
MDWGRAKSVLIVSFLVLNVLLGYQLWLNVRDQVNPNVDLTALPEDTLRIMQEKGITITASVPGGTPRMGDLQFRFDGRRGASDKIPLDPQVDSRIVFSERELVEGLGKVIADLELYRFDQALQTDEAFVFTRIAADGRPIFDVKLELYYSNQKIVAYRQDRIEPVISEESEPQTVLPASKALAPLIDNYLQPGAVIKEIQLGYHGQLFNTDDIQAAEPSWRVLLEDGSIYYINAISGAVATEQDAAASETDGEAEGV